MIFIAIDHREEEMDEKIMVGFENLEEELKNVEWKKYKLSDVAQYIRGITYSKHDECKTEEECASGYKVFRANNINLQDSSIVLDDLKSVYKTVKVNPNQYLQVNDVLICAGSGSKEHIGKVSYITSEYKEYLFGGFMGVIRAINTDLINPRFMFYLLKSQLFRNYLNNSLMTSTINNLSSSIMNNFEFLLPPVEMQNKIVHFLDVFTALITALRTEEKKRKEKKRKEQYKSYLTNLISLDKKYINLLGINNTKDIVPYKFSDICNISCHGELPKDFLKSTQPVGEYVYPVISNGIKTKSLTGFCKKPGITSPSVTYSSVGTIGNPTIYYEPFTSTAGLQVFTPKDHNKLDIKYLKFLLETVKFSMNNSTMKYVTTSIISNYVVDVPSIDIQRNIVKILEKMEIYITDIKSGLPAEIQLRQQQLQYYLHRFCCPDFSKQ